jgi:hypothetical protein
MDTWGEYTQEYQRHSSSSVDLPANQGSVAFNSLSQVAPAVTKKPNPASGMAFFMQDIEIENRQITLRHAALGFKS